MNYERGKHFPVSHSIFVYIFNNLNLSIFIHLISRKFTLSKKLQNLQKVYAMIFNDVEFIHIKEENYKCHLLQNGLLAIKPQSH